MSDSVRPQRRQPTRLPRPWHSPGKNTGVRCHFLLQCMKVKSESEVAQSCSTLHDPMDCSPPGSSIHGIFQARVPESGAIAFSGSVPLLYLKCPPVSSFCCPPFMTRLTFLQSLHRFLPNKVPFLPHWSSHSHYSNVYCYIYILPFSTDICIHAFCAPLDCKLWKRRRWLIGVYILSTKNSVLTTC